MLSPPRISIFLRWVGTGAVTVFPFQQQALDLFVALMQRFTQAPRTEMDLADGRGFDIR